MSPPGVVNLIGKVSIWKVDSNLVRGVLVQVQPTPPYSQAENAKEVYNEGL